MRRARLIFGLVLVLLIGVSSVLYSQKKKQEGTPPTLENVAYGPHERNVLDFWKAKSEGPAPVLIFIHGGGFVGGDKKSIRGSAVLEGCLKNGVSFASINYRFRTTTPMQEIMRDAARAVQFIRHNAKAWNVDIKRIASHGSSAGAGTSLWLAFHDDLADPDNKDPILRQSTRIVAAGARNTQFTYDFEQWESVLGVSIYDFYPADPRVYGLKTMDEVETERGKRLRADVDMRGLVTKDDPPVFLFCSQAGGKITKRGHFLHHPKHSIAIKDKCDAEGVGAVLYLSKEGSPPPGGVNKAQLAFFLKHLGVE